MNVRARLAVGACAGARPKSGPDAARRNRLLGAVPEAEWRHLERYLEPVELSRGQTLYASGSPPHHAFFPTSSIISMLGVEPGGASTEIASVGNEGMVGISVFLGGETTPRQKVVQRDGWAYRIPAAALKYEFDRSAALRHLCLSYTQTLLSMVAQMAICNRHHSITQRMCYWLLLNLDRHSSNEIRMTHQMLAGLLGVRREGITEAARFLQIRSCITYHRGRITVTDRSALKAICCNCYALIRREFDRLPKRRAPGSLLTEDAHAVHPRMRQIRLAEEAERF